MSWRFIWINTLHMAKQVGSNPITGTIDDLNFYVRKDQYLVRLKPGPSRKKFKTHPHYERPRAQSELFARLSSMCGHLRRQLRWGRANVFDGNINGRMMKLFNQLSKLDPEGRPGEWTWQRALHLPQAAGLLSGFVFHEDHPISKILRADIEVDHEMDDKVIITAIPRKKMVCLPNEGTHLGIEFIRISVFEDKHIYRDGSVIFPPTKPSDMPIKIELSLLPPERPGPWLYVLRLVPYHELDGLVIRLEEAVWPMEMVGVRVAEMQY